MTTTLNIHDAETQLSTLVECAEAGEDVVIARAGKPVVRLVRIEPHSLRVPGGLEGLREPDGFFGPLTDEELADYHSFA